MLGTTGVGIVKNSINNITCVFKISFCVFLGLVLQTDDNSNVRVKLESWKDDPKQLWDLVPVGEKTDSVEERIRLLSTTTEI